MKNVQPWRCTEQNTPTFCTRLKKNYFLNQYFHLKIILWCQIKIVMWLTFWLFLHQISSVPKVLLHPPCLLLTCARLLVAVAKSGACWESCLGATWNDKMRMRTSGWHMVLINSQVYRGSLYTGYNQSYSQHPAHWTSSGALWFPPWYLRGSETDNIWSFSLQTLK